MHDSVSLYYITQQSHPIPMFCSPPCCIFPIPLLFPNRIWKTNWTNFQMNTKGQSEMPKSNWCKHKHIVLLCVCFSFWLSEVFVYFRLICTLQFIWWDFQWTIPPVCSVRLMCVSYGIDNCLWLIWFLVVVYAKYKRI